jgi:hypothetical protein
MGFQIERQAEPIPGYRLVEPLGRGAFGEVWKAEAPGGILKAIKFVFGDLDNIEKAAPGAEQELKSLARVKGVRHPFLLSLERFDIVGGQLVIVTELADRDLWDRFRECRSQGLPGVPRDELQRYLEETAEVLDLMNVQYDLQHMDVKPQNLCLMHSHIKVADFGLVKDLTGLVASLTGGLTPKYAPPEAFRGLVSRFSDQYSLAVVYMELLTGQPPFTAATPHELMLLHTEAQPNLASLSPQERAAVAVALSKDPNRRFPSCHAFVQALREATRPAGGGPAAPSLPPSLRSTPPAPAPGPARAEEVATKVTPWHTVRGALAQPSTPAIDMVEEQGDGVLVPALVVGLGRFGLEALRRLRREFHARMGGPARLPNLRFLGIDTDPETAELALQGDEDEALRREEVVLARLSRASHYARPTDHLPPLQDWLPSKAIFRIPRNLVTGGSRALGRLAFVDNYRAIVNPLRRDLERVTAAEVLRWAADESGLGLRSSRPRVYVIAGLAGGTGGGMFLDLAYVARALLRERGYRRPEVVGLFLLPPAAPTGGPPQAASASGPCSGLARANAYAALVELNHFASGQEPFQALYDAKAAPLPLAALDPEPPFSRAVLLPAPPGEEAAGPSPADLAGAYLSRELLTLLGREAEAARPAEADRAADPRGFTFQTFGLHVPTAPGPQALRPEAERLGQALLGQWLGKGPSDLGPRVRQEIQEGLRGQGLDPQGILAEWRAECTRQLGKVPEDTLAGLLEPVADSGAPWSFDLARVPKVLRQMEQFLGDPEEGTLQPGPVLAALRDAGERLGRRYRHFLCDLIGRYLDRPGYRLVGAAEAVNQASALVGRAHQLQESQAAQLGTRVQELAGLIQRGLAEAERAVGGAGKRGRGAEGEARLARLLSELAKDLSEYSRARYQHLLLLRLTGLSLSLRGFLSDQVREVGFYREAISALQGSLAPPPGGRPTASDEPGVSTGRGETPLASEDWLRLDQQIQNAVAEHFRGAASPCSAALAGKGLKELRALIVQEAEKFLAGRLPQGQDAAEHFLARHPSEEALGEAIQQAFAAAAPLREGAGVPPDGEFSLLLAPASEAGERFLEAAGRVLPPFGAVTEAGPSGSASEVVFYREGAGLTLAELEQLGLVCLSSYAHACSHERYTPHARLDVVWRGPVRPERPAAGALE